MIDTPFIPDEDLLEEALSEAANMGAVSTAYPWSDDLLKILDRVADSRTLTPEDREEAIALIDAMNVDADIEDADNG